MVCTIYYLLFIHNINTYFTEQAVSGLQECILAVQSCAEYQSKVADDVISFSNNNSIIIANAFFFPHNLLQSAIQMFAVHATNKVIIIIIN